MKNPHDPAEVLHAFGTPDDFMAVGAAGAHSFFVQLLQHAPAPIYVTSPDGRYLFVNRAWEEVGGVPAGRALGRLVGEMFSPETARRLQEANRRVLTSGAPLALEEVVETGDAVRHFHTVKFPVRDAAGAVVAVGGVSIDITERKRADEALGGYAGRLQSLSRRLQEVQEQERRRLARELHDEVGQILTGLDLTLKQGGRLGDDGLRTAVGEARELLRDLTARVRDLSLRLRPSMLDDLGLAPALVWHLERYTAQAGVAVAFHHAGLARRFSPEGETAAYRIVQEALTNVARHSGAAEANVRISLDGGVLRLEIEDGGAGFDAEAALKSGACCGLSGMRQRAALLGGRLDVQSAPGAGTRLTAEWPEGAAGEERDGADTAGG